MISKQGNGSWLFALLLLLPLAACEPEKQAPAQTKSLGSYPTSISFDLQDNAYIATVSGDIIRYDGQQLSQFISKGTHGLTHAADIRFANNQFYIHNKRYLASDSDEIDEVLLFSAEGSYLSQLITQDKIQTPLFEHITVNKQGQLYAITNQPDVIRINYDQQDLIRFSPAVPFTATIRSYDKILTGTDTLAIASILNRLDDTAPADLSEPEIILVPDSLHSVDPVYINDGMPSKPPPAQSALAILSGSDTHFSNANLLGIAQISSDRYNNIYISSLYGIFKFDPAGQYLQTIALYNQHDIKIIRHLAIDPDDNIIIATDDPRNSASLRFLKFDADGHYLGLFISTDDADMAGHIQDMAFDSIGNFYIIDSIKGVLKFDQSGQFEAIIASPY